MKTMIALAAIVAATAAAPAFAEDSHASRLARETGLSERQIQMILGDRTAFAEYRTSYDLSVRKFQRALGEDNHNRLLSGQPIVLPRTVTAATAVAVVADDEQSAP